MRSRDRAAVFTGALIAVAIGVAYWGSYHGPFVLDDAASIVDNASIRKLFPLGPVLVPPQEAGVGGRPLANLSFALNYAIRGLAPWTYHATNVALHLLNALLLFGVVRRTLARSPSPVPFSPHATVLAGAAALLWGVHPLATAAVDYVSQRTELLMALCYLLTFYGFSRSLDAGARGWKAIAVLACAAGMASKEVMITAPVLLLLYDRVFVAGSFRAAWRDRGRFHLLLASTWLLLAGLMVTSRVTSRGVGFGLGVEAKHYFLNSCVAIVRYLRLSLWPTDLVFDYGWAYTIEASLVGPFVAIVTALVVVVAIALKRWPAAGFAGAFFLGVLAPTSLVPIIQQPIAESRVYLPLAAVVGLGVVAAHRILIRRRHLGVVVVVLVAVALATTTQQRHADYRTELALWSDTAAKRPDSARAHGHRAAALFRANRLHESTTASLLALHLRPDYADAHNNLGVALLRSGHRVAAIAHFEAALRSRPNDFGTHYNLAEALLETGRMGEAFPQFETSLRLNPDQPHAHNNLAFALQRSGRAREALHHAHQALQLQPNFAEAHYNLANILLDLGQTDDAMVAFAATIQCNPRFAQAHNNLGVLLLKRGRVDEATAHLEAAIEIAPNYTEAQRNLVAARKSHRPSNP